MQEKSVISTDTTNHNDINKMQANILSVKRDANIDLVAQMTKTLATMTTDATNSTTNTTVSVDNKTIDATIEQKSSPIIMNNSNSTTIMQPSLPLPSPPPTSHTPQSNVIATRPTKRTANDYRFGKTIGEGSFSTVYLAKDIYTNREVASEYIFAFFCIQFFYTL